MQKKPVWLHWYVNGHDNLIRQFLAFKKEMQPFGPFDLPFLQLDFLLFLLLRLRGKMTSRQFKIPDPNLSVQLF
jgi:hypothetical protein